MSGDPPTSMSLDSMYVPPHQSSSMTIRTGPPTMPPSNSAYMGQTPLMYAKVPTTSMGNNNNNINNNNNNLNMNINMKVPIQPKYVPSTPSSRMPNPSASMGMINTQIPPHPIGTGVPLKPTPYTPKTEPMGLGTHPSMDATNINTINNNIDGTGGKIASAPSKANPFTQNISRTSPATVVWLHENYEAAEGVSLGRSTLYQHYANHCTLIDQEPVNPASFGKLIRSVFPYLKTRRLGTRGNSKYHYYGIRVKGDSKLTFAPDQIGGPQQRIRASTGGTTMGGPGLTGTTPGGKPKIEKDKDDDSSSIEMGDFIDTRVELPEFPPMNVVQGLEKADDFNKPYRAHCQDILKTLGKADFLQLIPDMWSQFWGVIAIHFRDVLGSTPGVLHVDRCDEIFFATLSTAIFTDVLCSMPEALIKQIRYFAKWMEPWIKTALEGYPQPLIEKKLVRVRAFGHALRRYTSLNHLAQAAQKVVQDQKQTEDMLRDISYVDFKAAIAQAEGVCDCTSLNVQKIEQDLKWALLHKFTLKQWASWLQHTIKTAVMKSPKPQEAARSFLMQWSFYSSIVIRDLTLRSAPSFGSFHLMRLLYDEYIIYLVELLDSQPISVLDVVPAGCTRAVPVRFDTGPTGSNPAMITSMSSSSLTSSTSSSSLGNTSTNSSSLAHVGNTINTNTNTNNNNNNNNTNNNNNNTTTTNNTNISTLPPSSHLSQLTPSPLLKPNASSTMTQSLTMMPTTKPVTSIPASLIHTSTTTTPSLITPFTMPPAAMSLNNRKNVSSTSLTMPPTKMPKLSSQSSAV